MVKEQFAEILRKIQNTPQNWYPHIILVEGSTSDAFGIGEVFEEVVNPVIETLPCALPGEESQTRNLRFDVETLGLKQKFTVYSFAAPDMFVLAQERIAERGYNFESLVLKSPL